MRSVPRPDPAVNPADLVHGLVRLVLDPRAPLGVRFAADGEAAPRFPGDRLPPHRFTLHVLETMAAQRALIQGLRIGRRNDLAWLAHEDLPVLLVAELGADPKGYDTVEEAIALEAEKGVDAELVNGLAEGLREQAELRAWRSWAAGVLRSWRPVLRHLRVPGQRSQVRKPSDFAKRTRVDWSPRDYGGYAVGPASVVLNDSGGRIRRVAEGFELRMVSRHGRAGNELPSHLALKALGERANAALAPFGFRFAGSADADAGERLFRNAIVGVAPDAAAVGQLLAATDAALEAMAATCAWARRRPLEVAAMSQPKAMAALARLCAGEAARLTAADTRALSAAGLVTDGQPTADGRRVAAEYATMAAPPPDGPSCAQAVYLAAMACLDYTIERRTRTYNGFYSSASHCPFIERSLPDAQIQALIDRGWLAETEKRGPNGEIPLALTEAALAFLPGVLAPQDP